MSATILVTSLRRLYHKGEVEREKLNSLLDQGKIDSESYQYILRRKIDD